MTDRYEGAVKLYEDGMTLRELAALYDVSFQAIHQALQKRGCVFRRRGRP